MTKLGFEKLARQVSTECERDILKIVHYARGDSEIERLFWLAMVATDMCKQNLGMPELGFSPSMEFEPNHGQVVMYSQALVAGVKVDFFFRIGGVGGGLIVECDGHDFHERTKEQAKKDRSRDRKFQECGFAIYRFTGSELWNDPRGCALQVWHWLSRHVYEGLHSE